MTNWTKYIVLILIIAGIASCKVKKAATDSNIIIIDDNTNNVSIKDDTIVNKPLDLKPDTIIIVEPILNLKDEYNVVLILPLLADSIFSNWSDHTEEDLKDFNIPKKSQEALTFLEGAMLALQNLELESKINIEVFDNEYSYAQTNFILNKLETKNVDLIIGPIKRQNIQLVSNFAKKKDILMLSPFSPSKSAGSKHYKYIMSEPTIDVHFNTISQFISDSIAQSSVKLFYPDTDFGIENAYKLQSIMQAMNDTLPLSKSIQYAMVEVASKTNDRRNFKIEDFLDTGIDNSIIIISFNEGFVHSMLTSLHQQLKSYDITVFGMPNWKESESLRLDYFESLNVHYTDSKWIDTEETNTSNFIKDFKEEYKAHPSESAYLGYDLFNCFPLWLDKYGLDLDKNIFKERYEGLLNTYHFTPLDYTIDSTETLSPRIENTNLHIIEYKNYELNLIK